MAKEKTVKVNLQVDTKRIVTQKVQISVDVARVLTTAQKVLKKVAGQFPETKEAINGALDEIKQQAKTEEAGAKKNQQEEEPYRPGKPSSHVSPNHLLVNKLFKEDLINAGPKDLAVLPEQGITAYVNAYVMTALDAGGGIKANIVTADNVDGGSVPKAFHLEAFERDVMDGVSSIWKRGQKDGYQICFFTAVDVYAAMPGGGGKPSKSMLEKIEKAITKLSRIRIEIDATDELRQLRILKQGEKFSKESNVLFVERYKAQSANGKVTNGWIIYQKPILYEYAELRKNIIEVPSRVIQIKEIKGGKLSDTNIAMSDNRRALVSHLVRRVGVILNNYAHAKESLRKYERRKKGNDKQMTIHSFMTVSTHINFDEVFSSAIPAVKDKSNLRDYKSFCVNDVFGYWKITGYIPGFSVLKKGRQITGIELVLPE